MKKLNTIDWIALILVIVGGLNWGLVAMNFDLVEYLVGAWPWLQDTVYGLVGLSAVWMIVVAFKKEAPAVSM